MSFSWRKLWRVGRVCLFQAPCSLYSVFLTQALTHSHVVLGKTLESDIDWLVFFWEYIPLVYVPAPGCLYYSLSWGFYYYNKIARLLLGPMGSPGVWGQRTRSQQNRLRESGKWQSRLVHSTMGRDLYPSSQNLGCVLICWHWVVTSHWLCMIKTSDSTYC